MPGFQQFRENLLRQLSGRRGQISQLLIDTLEKANSEEDFEKFADELNRRRGLNRDQYSQKRKNLRVLFQRIQTLEDEYDSAGIRAERDLIAGEIEDQLDQLESTKRVALMYQKNVRLLTSMISKTEQLIAQLSSGLAEENVDQLGSTYAQEADKWDGLFAAEVDLKEILPETIVGEEDNSTSRQERLTSRRSELEPDGMKGLPDRLKKRKAELLGPETE